MSIAELLISIANKMKSIKNNVLAAYDAVASKDGKVPIDKTTTNLVAAINSIPAQRVARLDRDGELGNKTLLIDFDGTPLYAYEPEEILALEELPPPYTTHERLSFAKWNYTLEEIKERVQSFGWMDVGAMYVPTDGWGEMEIEIEGPNPSFSPHFRMWLRTEGTLSIDWGDETPLDEYDGKDFDVRHTYARKGRYLVRFISTTQFYGIYCYNDTKALVVGRFVFPTNSYGVGFNHEGIYKSGGNNPQENNTIYTDPQCLAYTRIETIVIPPGCCIYAQNLGSGLTHMPCLKSIVCDVAGIWRAPDRQFPSIRFFSLAHGFQTLNKSQCFVNAKSIQETGTNTYNYIGGNTAIPYQLLERMNVNKSLYMGQVSASFPLIRTLEGYRFPSNGMFWSSGGITGLKYCENFPKPEEEGKIAYFQSLNDNVAIKDYAQEFISGSGNYFPTFARNYSLQTLTLSCGNARIIKPSSFVNDYHLKEIHLKYPDLANASTVVTLQNVNAFSGCASDLKIYVPEILVESYKTATNWSTYAEQIFAEPEIIE